MHQSNRIRLGMHQLLLAHICSKSRMATQYHAQWWLKFNMISVRGTIEASVSNWPIKVYLVRFAVQNNRHECNFVSCRRTIAFATLSSLCWDSASVFHIANEGSLAVICSSVCSCWENTWFWVAASLQQDVDSQWKAKCTQDHEQIAALKYTPTLYITCILHAMSQQHLTPYTSYVNIKSPERWVILHSCSHYMLCKAILFSSKACKITWLLTVIWSPWSPVTALISAVEKVSAVICTLQNQNPVTCVECYLHIVCM